MLFWTGCTGWMVTRSACTAPFVKLTEAQQVAILRSLDVASEGPGPRFFRAVKGWTSRIYYQTDIGMRELNKGGRVPSPQNMGCPAHQPRLIARAELSGERRVPSYARQ
jgi:hypothetical protein